MEIQVEIYTPPLPPRGIEEMVPVPVALGDADVTEVRDVGSYVSELVDAER